MVKLQISKQNHGLTKSVMKKEEYHRAKSYNWRVKSVENKNNLIRCSKEYKRCATLNTMNIGKTL
jgi:hypothetical protein